MAFDRSDPDDSAEALLARYGAGDAAAAAALVRRLAPGALALAGRLLGDPDEAEDVAQEAMLRLWRAAPGWRFGEARVTTWLHQVVVNLCRDHWRRKRPATGVELPELPDPAEPASAALQRRDRQAALARALARLPERQRLAVVLRDLQGQSARDAAAVLELQPDAVDSLLARGRRALRAVLGPEREALGFEDDGN